MFLRTFFLKRTVNSKFGNAYIFAELVTEYSHLVYTLMKTTVPEVHTSWLSDQSQSHGE